MAAAVTYRSIVREIALDQYGYVTTRDAMAAGVPSGELSKLAARGGLENVAYGIYRVSGISPTRYDEFAEAILRSGEGAYLWGESVLALHELAHVNARRLQIAVPRRARPRLPAFIELTRAPVGAPTAVYEGLKSQSVADAIIECKGRIETQRLIEAASDARAAGLLTSTELVTVRKALRG